MKFLTIAEYESTPIACLDNAIYNRIESAFMRLLGKYGKRFMEKHLDCTVKELSLNNYVNVMDCVTIL